MRKEPVLLAALARVAVGLASHYGLDLSIEQVLSALTVLEMVLAAIVRSKVTPA